MTKGIKQARRFLVEKKYSKVIHLLTPQIFLYRNNPEFHEILGQACLRSNDFGGAYTYFQRVVNIDPKNTTAKLGIAYILVRRGRTTQALQEWLEVIENDDSNSQAKKGLDLIKSAPEDRDWPEWFSNHPTDFLLPPTGFAWRPIIRVVSAVVGLSVILLGGFWVLTTLQKPREITRAGGEVLLFSSDTQTIGSSGSFSLIFTEAQVEDILNKTIDAFEAYQDNRVRFLINRLQHSNAAEDIKTKTLLLQDHLAPPNFVDPFWYPELREVLNTPNPEQYQGVFTLVSGKVSNVVQLDDRIRFDLLVGYQEQQVLQAVIPVQVFFPVELNGGENVEIIGEISLIESTVTMVGFELTAASIRFTR
ncbi:tetratricopeptide repeat protein [Spirochaeta lutea]|nr:tetratricopeptide repeat protein [Spirochaeta lutea]